MLSLFLNKENKKRVSESFIKTERNDNVLSTCDEVMELDNFSIPSLIKVDSKKTCFDKQDIELIIDHYRKEPEGLMNQVGVIIIKNNIDKLCLVNKNEKHYRRIYNNSVKKAKDDIETHQFVSISKILDK
jgi:hypothetical protein